MEGISTCFVGTNKIPVTQIKHDPNTSVISGNKGVRGGAVG